MGGCTPNELAHNDFELRYAHTRKHGIRTAKWIRGHIVPGDQHKNAEASPDGAQLSKSLTPLSDTRCLVMSQLFLKKIMLCPQKQVLAACHALLIVVSGRSLSTFQK